MLHDPKATDSGTALAMSYTPQPAVYNDTLSRIMNIQTVTLLTFTAACILTCTSPLAHVQYISQFCFCHMIKLSKLH